MFLSILSHGKTPDSHRRPWLDPNVNFNTEVCYIRVYIYMCVCLCVCVCVCVCVAIRGPSVRLN